MGGLHSFMGWDKGLLTDSGGFQMVSLLQLSEMAEVTILSRSPLFFSSFLFHQKLTFEDRKV